MVYKAQLDDGKKGRPDNAGQTVQTGSDYQSSLSRHQARRTEKRLCFVDQPTSQGRMRRISKKIVSEMRIVSSPEKCGVIKITNINRKGLRH